MNFFDGCNPIDCALETIEDLGLNIAKIGIFTREWSEEKLGMGKPSDSVEYFSPTPRLRTIKQSHSSKEGGLEKRGDLSIRLLSKDLYPTKEKLEVISQEKNKEIYYFINDELYELVEVTEHLTHWNVLVKKAKKRKLYL